MKYGGQGKPESKKFANIEDGKVVKIDLVTQEFLLDNLSRFSGVWIEAPDSVTEGFTYDSEVFTAPKPYDSWILNNNIWEPPIAKPDGDYQWNHNQQQWEIINYTQ